MDALGQYFFIFITVYSFVAELDAVTVSPPLCPPNKIVSPQWRRQAIALNGLRGGGLKYDLLGPVRLPGPKLDNNLEEQPQDDCDELRDYDEELSSGRIRPVKEDISDRPQAPYRPALIGGLLQHIVGFPSVRPLTEDEAEKTKEREHKQLREPGSPIRFPSDYSNNISRQKKSQQTNNKYTNIIGPFVDLLLKTTGHVR